MEVASVNYEARRFGLFNRISVAEAKRLCPELVLVRGDNGVNGMQRYRCSKPLPDVLARMLTALLPAGSRIFPPKKESLRARTRAFDARHVHCTAWPQFHARGTALHVENNLYWCGNHGIARREGTG